MRIVKSVSNQNIWSKTYPDNLNGLVTTAPPGVTPKVGHAVSDNGSYWTTKPSDKYFTMEDGSIEKWTALKIATVSSGYGTISFYTRVKV